MLYDRDCNFCRWSLQRVLAWDRRGRLRSLALQDPQAERLLAAVEASRRMESWHLVLPDGSVHSAGRALAPMLELLPGGRPLARLASAFPDPVDRAYALIARHRSKLGRVLSSER